MDDRATFDKMFNEWYAQFVYFAYYFINDAEVCRDIVSDAFEYLWRNYEKIEEATAKTYLLWGIERSGFFNDRGKWAKGFENQRV